MSDCIKSSVYLHNMKKTSQHKLILKQIFYDDPNHGTEKNLFYSSLVEKLQTKTDNE